METIAIARAPVCIHLGGDPGDLTGCSDKASGFVISAATSYYAYAILTPSQLSGVQVTFGGEQAFSKAVELAVHGDRSELSLLAAIAHHFDITDGQRVFVASQVPPAFGPGARASLAVAMIKVLAFRCGLDLDPRAVAELACYIESQGRDESLEPACARERREYAYAAAFGGLNCISSSDDDFDVRPLRIAADTRELLERRLLLFTAENLVPESAALDPKIRFAGNGKKSGKKAEAGDRLALDIRTALEKGSLDTFGRLLSRCRPQASPGRENHAFFEQSHYVALEHGALGGRMIGADGGGFFLFYCSEEYQPGVVQALAALGLCRWPLILEEEGVQIMQMVPWMWSSGMPPVPWSQPAMSPPAPVMRESHVEERHRY